MTLHSAHIKGQLAMDGARINGSVKGTSLVAQGLRAESDVILRHGFQTAGTVSLEGAEVAGELTLQGARLGAPPAGFSLDARNLRADGDVIIGSRTALIGPIRFAGAHIGRLSLPSTGELPALASAAGWQLGDLWGGPRTNRRLAAQWLDTQTSTQPWQEVAALYERIGQPADARWIRYRSAVRSTRSGPPSSRIGRWVSWATTGHGYYAAPLTVGWLLGIFLVAWAVTGLNAGAFTTGTTPTIRQAIVAEHQANGITTPPPVPGRVPARDWNETWDAPEFQPWTYALATAVPTTSSAASQPWTPGAGGVGVVLAALRAASWIFTALFLAGITGLLRKQT